AGHTQLTRWIARPVSTVLDATTMRAPGTMNSAQIDVSARKKRDWRRARAICAARRTSHSSTAIDIATYPGRIHSRGSAMRPISHSSTRRGNGGRDTWRAGRPIPALRHANYLLGMNRRVLLYVPSVISLTRLAMAVAFAVSEAPA